MHELYSTGDYPVGELFEWTTQRTSGEELRAREKLVEDQLNDLRQAAEAHRQVWGRVIVPYVYLPYPRWGAGKLMGPGDTDAQVRAVVDPAWDEDV
jgi:hypothetical protein